MARGFFGCFLVGSVAVIASGLVVGCKGSSSSDSSGRLCTPGNYVFCRCADRSEGTKLCKAEGDAFEPCKCGTADNHEPLAPDGNSAFQPVDAGAPSPSGVPVIDQRCAGKLAVLASSEEDFFLFAAAYAGNGNWSVGKSQGPALRSQPRAVVVDGTLIAVWRSRYDLLAWTKFQIGQTSLTPPDSIGNASTAAPPALVAIPGAAKVFYLGAKNVEVEGAFTSAAGWNSATNAIPTPTTNGTLNLAGKTAPTAASVGTSSVIAYAGTNGQLVRQVFTAGAWTGANPIPGAQAFAQTPALAAMDGGTKDLLIVYVGTDLRLHSSARAIGATPTWSDPILVDNAATVDGQLNLAPMSGGRAMLLFRNAAGKPYYTVYDPAKESWSNPTELVVGKNPTVPHTPSVVEGRCGSDATVAYAEQDGAVNVMRYEGGAFNGPFPVAGMTKMSFVGAGEVP